MRLIKTINTKIFHYTQHKCNATT